MLDVLSSTKLNRMSALYISRPDAGASASYCHLLARYKINPDIVLQLYLPCNSQLMCKMYVNISFLMD